MIYLREYFDQVIYNVVRSPEFNPIETVFNMIKHHYKKNQNFDKDQVISKIIESINTITIKHVRKSFINSLTHLYEGSQ